MNESVFPRKQQTLKLNIFGSTVDMRFCDQPTEGIKNNIIDILTHSYEERMQTALLKISEKKTEQ